MGTGPSSPGDRDVAGTTPEGPLGSVFMIQGIDDIAMKALCQ